MNLRTPSLPRRRSVRLGHAPGRLVALGGLLLALSSCGSPLQSGGELHLEGQRYDRAAAVLEAEVAKHPANTAAWMSLGRAYAELDSVDRALHAFDRAVALDSTQLGEVLRQRSFHAARLAGRGRGFLAEALAMDAAAPQRRERLERAGTGLTRAQRLDPADGTLQLDLYRLSRAEGDSLAAADHLFQAARLAEAGRLPPSDAALVYRERGHDAVRRHDYPAAISLFDAAARLTPDNPDLLIDLAAAHLLQAETSGAGARAPLSAYRDATRILETVRRLRPEDPDALYNLATIRFRLGQFSGADSLLSDYVALRPDDADAWQLRAQVFLELGREGMAQTAGLAGDLLAINKPVARPEQWAQDELQRNGSGSALGRLYAELGPPDRVDYRQARNGRISQVWLYVKARRIVAFKDGAQIGEPIRWER